MSSIYTCQFEDHDGETIIGYCLNLQCKLPPQCCTYCMQKKHFNHQDDCKGFKSIKKLLQQQINQVDLEKSLYTILQQVKQRIDKFIKKYKADQENLIQIDKMFTETNYQEIKNYLPFIKSYYFKIKQKTKIESEIQVQLIDQFKTLCEDQKKILSQFNINYRDQQFIEGTELFKQKKIEEAIIKFDLILNGSLNCDDLSQKGRALQKLKNYSKALQCIDRGFEINPGHCNLNAEKACQNDNIQASNFQENSNKKDLVNALSFNSHGNSLNTYKSSDETVTCQETVIQLQINYVDANINQGIVSFLIDKKATLQDNENIIEYKQFKSIRRRHKMLRQSHSIRPQFIHATIKQRLILFCYFSKGNFLSMLKKFEDTIKCYEKSIQLNNKDALEQKRIVLDNQKQKTRTVEPYSPFLQKHLDLIEKFRQKHLKKK